MFGALGLWAIISAHVQLFKEGMGRAKANAYVQQCEYEKKMETKKERRRYLDSFYQHEKEK